ncbi:hypothetical protein EVAR_66079_1 [Eumeta japonica]|uniref:Uncharacterized protein n=1 Tax=Eumeta variegata TaxID=151549 RepID=A0A4C2A339_EUMVA|nr:hypothetical protein EVAR_66079_1 [Eumeta japonica]
MPAVSGYTLNPLAYRWKRHVVAVGRASRSRRESTQIRLNNRVHQQRASRQIIGVNYCRVSCAARAGRGGAGGVGHSITEGGLHAARVFFSCLC